MVRTRDIVVQMEERGIVICAKYFDDIDGFQYLHGCSAIFHSDNLNKLTDKWKGEKGIDFTHYQIDKIKGENTVGISEDFGFNLRLIKSDLKKFKINNIWIPNRWGPCYINIGDGYYYVLAPFRYLDETQKEKRLKLSKPQKALSSFW